MLITVSDGSIVGRNPARVTDWFVVELHLPGEVTIVGIGEDLSRGELTGFEIGDVVAAEYAVGCTEVLDSSIDGAVGTCAT